MVGVCEANMYGIYILYKKWERNEVVLRVSPRSLWRSYVLGRRKGFMV